MSEKRIVGNEVKNRMVFYIVMVLTLVLTLGFSNAVSAKTKVKTYKITYVLKGGTNNKKNTKKYKSTKNTKLYSPKRKGYTFKGWYKDKNYAKRIRKIKKVLRETNGFMLYGRLSNTNFHTLLMVV